MKALALTAFALVASQSFAASRVLVDFSEPPRAINYQLTATQEKQILDSMFAQHVGNLEECQDAEAGVHYATITYAVRGKFTSAPGKQIVAAVRSQDCSSGRAGTQGHLVLVEEGQVTATASAQGNGIQLVYDEDGDGLQEVVATDGGTWQGYTIVTAGSYTFKNSVIRATGLIDGPGARDNCGSLEDNKEEIVAVFFKRTERPMTVTQKNYVKPCGAANSAFKFHSNGPLEGI
ncbi:MAG: hypothetical protein AB7G93_14405 [Bdellovibrionales bacterium]